MAEPDDWQPDAPNWAQEDYEKARRISESGSTKIRPERMEKLRNAVSWYERNMLNEPPGGEQESYPPKYPGIQQPTGVEGEPKIVEVTAEDGGPIRIEGDPTPAPPPKEHAWYDVLADAGRSLADSYGHPIESAKATLASPVQTAADAWRGLARGFTADFGDEWASKLTPEASDDTGIPRTYKAGSADLDLRGTMRREDKEADARSPWAALSGQIAGSTPRGVLEVMAAGPVGGSAIEGGVSALGASESDDPTEQAADAAAGAALGVALPLAFRGAGKLSGKVGEALEAGSESLRSRANINRLAAAGPYGAQLRNIAQNKGPEAVQQLGEDIERLGFHKGKGMLGWLPQPADTYADNAARMLDDAGTRMGAAEDAIAAAGDPPVKVGGIDADLRAAADTHAARFDARAGAQQASFERDIADAIDAAGRPAGAQGPSTGEVPFSRALEERRYLDDQIDWNRKGGFEGAGMQEQVRRGVAGDMRAAIREGLDDAAAKGQVDPATVAKWKQANADYATAATVHEPAMARMYQEYGNQKIGLPGWLAGIAGASTGNPAMALATGAAGQAAKHRGASALAGTQRFGQRALDVAAAPFEALAEIGSFAARGAERSPWAAQRVTGMPERAASIPFVQQPARAQDEWAALAQAGGNARQQSQDATREREQAAAQASQNGQGQNLTAALKKLIDFGAPEIAPYAKELKEAADAGDVELANALGRLEDGNPEFKRTVLPLLQQIANNQ